MSDHVGGRFRAFSLPQTLDFKYVIASTPDICQGYCRGLQALKASDRINIKVSDTKLLDGSVDIDKNTAVLYPGASRWDYAIGYGHKVFYVEVHPAGSRNVDKMAKKKEWLVNWLKTKAPLLDSYPSGTPLFIWVATAAGVHIPKTSTEYRKAALLKLLPKRSVTIG